MLALPNDLDALRALVSRMSSERDVATISSAIVESSSSVRRLDRDQMQLALEDIETSLANWDVEKEEKQQNRTPTSRRIEARSGASTAARCRRIFLTVQPVAELDVLIATSAGGAQSLVSCLPCPAAPAIPTTLLCTSSLAFDALKSAVLWIRVKIRKNKCASRPVITPVDGRLGAFARATRPVRPAP
jgi:hypothetical protein